MAEFKTTLSKPDLKFTPLTPSRKPDSRKAVIEGIGQIATIAGKSIAKSAASDIVGADLTQQEVNEAADFIDQEIATSLAGESVGEEGPILLTDRRVNEIKDVQLSKFAKNDRVLLALRDQGTISTTEARARRQLNLQRALSNPINAMFKNDFLNAMSDLTGGSTGAAKALFPLTAEEEQAQKISQAQQKSIAEFEGTLTSLELSTGKTRPVLRQELQEAEQDKQDILTLERISRSRTLSNEEAGRKLSAISNNVTRGISTLITQFSTENGGKGFNTQGKTVIERSVDQQHQAMVEMVNSDVTLGNKEKDGQIERLRKWRVGMDGMVKIYDATRFDKALIESLEQQATLSGWKTFPELMYLNSVSPDLLKVFMASGGIHDTFDRVLGEGIGQKVLDAAKSLSSLADLVEGKTIIHPSSVTGILSSSEGVAWLNSAEAQDNKNIQRGLATIYNEASEESLRMYLSSASRISARKGEPIRENIDRAMIVIRDRVNSIKKIIGATSIPITATSIPRGGTVKVPRVVIDVPDNMVDFSGTLSQMYKTIEAHPWSWEHVSEKYIDAADAFNGYLRGEWEFNIESPGVEPTKPKGLGKEAKQRASEKEQSRKAEQELTKAIAEEEANK